MKTTNLSTEKRLFRILLYVLYVFIAFLPIIVMGVQCNDDLTWRLYASQGIDVLASRYWEAAKAQGRCLSVVQILSLYLSFFDNRVLFGIVKALVILLNIALIAKLLKQYASERSAAIFAVIAPLFISITFYHSPPSAFTMFISFPFAWLLTSLLLYSAYLKTKRQYQLVFSLLLYFGAMCAYEIFIFYSPLFALIAFIEKRGNLKESVISIRFHVIVGFAYLLTYMVVRNIFPSSYAGNTVNLGHLEKSVSIWAMLVKSGIPGSYVFSGKGKYIFDVALGSPASDMRAIFQEINITRVVVLLIVAIVFLVSIFRKSNHTPVKYSVAGAMVAIYCILIPPMINAVSESWLAVDTVNDPQGSTVSYLISLSVVVIFSLVLSTCVRCKWSRFLSITMCGVILFYAICVQVSNDVYSILGRESSDRIERIEDVLSTFTVENQNVEDIYAPEACEAYYLQAAPEFYWRNYAYYNGTPALSETYCNQSVSLNMIDNGKIWAMGVDSINDEGKVFCSQLYILSENSLQGKTLNLVDNEMNLVQYVCGSPYKDGRYFVEPIEFNKYIWLDSVTVVR